ncbi:MAG: ABC transporter ATP-binding protein [Bacilli bacterium]|nr:ABC transporter ATP-binding protein [Bacilli bacterium]
MLNLKNVSKFYYTKGMVASGFSKINLQLEINEFVAITGESGSGKSTLLNVISGLDSYEEGEMYINDEETSGYTEKDFEAYRKKYIANIFQNFNLVNSYTVYQNIELILLLNGFNKKDIKNKIIDVIKKVDLYKYRNTKASKLSGGQKQRVAIARALVKDTPIILADEPTGNLDSKAAEAIMELLYNVSKDKLVIIVTHNYEQIEKYVTRKIKMNDGKIIEDKKIKTITEIKKPILNDFKEITFFNKIRLGIRNAFNIFPKFLLLLMVYLFLSVSVISEYSSYKKQEYVYSNNGNNQYFVDKSDKRLIIQKNDLSTISDEEYNKIINLENIDYIVKNDLLIDKSIVVHDDNLYFEGTTYDLNLLKNENVIGKMPENENEIIIVGSKDNYNLSDFNVENDNLLNKEMFVQNYDDGSNVLNYKLKIVGIIYDEDLDYSVKFYVNNKVLDDIRKSLNSSYSSVEILFNNEIYSSDSNYGYYKITTSNLVKPGSVYIPEEMNYKCQNSKCINYPVKINIKNMYFENELNLTVEKTYNEKNIKTLLNIDDYASATGNFYVNPNDYINLFDKGNYQSTIYINNIKQKNETIDELQNLGFAVLDIKKTLVDPYKEAYILSKAFKIIISIILTTALFFISYFVIKIILKSRNIYFSTIRILGSTRKNAKNLLNIELFTILNLAYTIILISVILINNNYINNTYLKDLISFLEVIDYFILYIILFVISLFISNRYARKLFKKSAMNTYREES